MFLPWVFPLPALLDENRSAEIRLEIIVCKRMGRVQLHVVDSIFEVNSAVTTYKQLAQGNLLQQVC